MEKEVNIHSSMNSNDIPLGSSGHLYLLSVKASITEGNTVISSWVMALSI